MIIIVFIGCQRIEMMFQIIIIVIDLKITIDLFEKFLISRTHRLQDKSRLIG